ncbi:MAG: hypothetical protein PVI91_02935 [Gammaproteobacteria bacterium]|jgi:hypothetical protein
MKRSGCLVGLGVVLALGAGQSVCVAEDSVYEWGRWAVLSPAAGGPAPYDAALSPDAKYNARPEEANEFSPKVLGGVQPPPSGSPEPVPGPEEPPGGDPRDRLPPLVEPVPGPAEPPTGDPRDRLPPLATQ